MLREYFCAADRTDKAIAWGGLLVIVSFSIASAYIKYSVNTWYTAFYDLLQKSGQDLIYINGTATNATAATLAESQREVVKELVTFLRIVLPYAVLSPVARWARSHWALRWRLVLMRTYMDGWDANEPPIEGASQRLHEDTQRFGKGVDSYLSVGLDATCVLAAFTPILFSLGGRVVAPHPTLQLFGKGWLFVCALASAVLGLGVAMYAGRELVGLEVANQRVEAEVRACVLME